MEKQITQNALAVTFKKLRTANGLTQQELADRLFCDVRQVRRYEKEGTDKLSVVNLYAQTFHVTTISILSIS